MEPAGNVAAKLLAGLERPAQPLDGLQGLPRILMAGGRCRALHLANGLVAAWVGRNIAARAAAAGQSGNVRHNANLYTIRLPRR